MNNIPSIAEQENNRLIGKLLAMELPKPEVRELKIKRLSEILGEDVIFKIKELTYSKVAEIKTLNTDDISAHIVLAGTVDPDFKNLDLAQKYGAVTPIELIKKMLRPGEVEDLSRQIEMLSGYRIDTIEEIKKK